MNKVSKIDIFAAFVVILYSAPWFARATIGGGHVLVRLLYVALAIVPLHLLLHYAGRRFPNRMACGWLHGWVYGQAAEKALENIFAVQSLSLLLCGQVVVGLAAVAIYYIWTHTRPDVDQSSTA